jgi:hypothetical protein
MDSVQERCHEDVSGKNRLSSGVQASKNIILLFILLGPLEQLLQHLGVLEPVIKLSVLLLVLRWGAQTMESQWISVHNLVHGVCIVEWLSS